MRRPASSSSNPVPEITIVSPPAADTFEGFTDSNWGCRGSAASAGDAINNCPPSSPTSRNHTLTRRVFVAAAPVLWGAALRHGPSRGATTSATDDGEGG